MAQYVCMVCGFVYDEEKGIPEAGIAPGTKWEDLPDDWECPLCGAEKSEFEKQGDADVSAAKKPIVIVKQEDDMREMSSLEMSALCSNLARGCEKQYKPEEAVLFNELATYYKASTAPAKEPDFEKLITLIEKDLKESIPNANAVSEDAKDRGGLRALVWNKKVTSILKSLLSRYKDAADSDEKLKNTGVWVCTICGFVFIGDAPPTLCPVCKVQSNKFEKVEGRV